MRTLVPIHETSRNIRCKRKQAASTVVIGKAHPEVVLCLMRRDPGGTGPYDTFTPIYRRG
jgi:hypothetical protein